MLLDILSLETEKSDSICKASVLVSQKSPHLWKIKRDSGSGEVAVLDGSIRALIAMEKAVYIETGLGN